MNPLLLAFAAILAVASSGASAETIVDAHYAIPVDRYGHFAPGRPHEYARISVGTSSGRQLALDLPEDEVFEDLAPRVVRLAADEPQQILAVVSNRNSGSRLALIGLHSDSLAMSAQSPAIGAARRWLNPVGVADLDGDGRAEIAAVITPHIGGPLKIYRRQGRNLVEIAALTGFSNHVYGTPDLALSAPMPIAGRMRLLVPDAERLQLRIITFVDGRLLESGRCGLPAPITGAIKLISPREISIGTASGRQLLVPADCLR